METHANLMTRQAVRAFPPGAGLPAQPLPGSVPAPGGKHHPLVQDLKRAARAALIQRLDTMFTSAGDILLEMSETAENEAERHAHFDAMRLLGFEQSHILRDFERQIERAFDADVPSVIASGPFDTPMALLPAQEMEESIALARIASTAKTRSKELIAALEQRLKVLERDLALPPVRRALTARRFCDAYCACLDRLDVGYAARKLLLKLFARTVMQDLDPVYQDLHAALDRHNPRIEAPRRLQADAESEGREQFLARVQHRVARDLAGLINGRQLHPGARRFLCCAMAPLMSVRLMQHGSNSKLWRDVLARVTLILRSLEPHSHEPEHRQARSEYLAAAAADLREIGVPESRIAELCNDLQTAYAELDLAHVSNDSEFRLSSR